MSPENSEAYFGLPKEVRFCGKCVISNQRPSSSVEFKNMNSKKEVIQFNDEGVCSACVFSEIKETKIDWERREKRLEELLNRHRRSDGGYDVIVPGSGGKDSAFAAHQLKYKYGMNPLTVTWAPHLYTDIGWRNFTNWMHVGGLDNILFTPNGRLHRLLTGLAFRNILHPFQPFIIGQKIIGPLLALKFGVRLVMYGDNQAEYGNCLDDNYIPQMDKKFFSVDNPENIILGGVPIKDIIKNYDFEFKDFTPYIPPACVDLEKAGVEVHFMSYYVNWDPQECYYYAAENTGFRANPRRTEGSYSKYSSIDDKTDPFHYYTTLIKFGIGRATYDASQEIRNKKITREEGVRLVRKYDTEFPARFFPEFLEYINMAEDEFYATIDRFRSPHLWKKENGEWMLKHTVWGEGS